MSILSILSILSKEAKQYNEHKFRHRFKCLHSSPYLWMKHETVKNPFNGKSSLFYLWFKEQIVVQYLATLGCFPESWKITVFDVFEIFSPSQDSRTWSFFEEYFFVLIVSVCMANVYDEREKNFRNISLGFGFSGFI